MTDMTVAMSNGSDQGEMIAELARLRQENDRLKAKVAARSTLSYKVTEKGGLSVYGLGRFPVTLYRGQWERLLKAKDDILAYVEEHKAELSVKE